MRITALVVVLPLIGLVLASLALHGIGRDGPELSPSAAPGRWRWAERWRTFPPGAVRADITGDVVATAGEEERFPWRLAPIRSLAIFATVGGGAAMGTEAPAAYLGVAPGACLADRGQRWRRLIRPAALGGGAAGVAALMGIPLVGTAYILELGRRHKAPLSVERVTAALIGGLVGWGIDVVFHLNLIRLIVPHEPPRNFPQAAITALFIGALSGAITAVAGWAIYKSKKWQASPLVRLALGGLAMALTAIVLVMIAAPGAAVGPGGGAILWAENANALPVTLLVVALLRAAATTAATAAGGCGGDFVPFLAVGDLAGRVFAPGLGVGNNLAGAAGAAGGIAGGTDCRSPRWRWCLGWAAHVWRPSPVWPRWPSRSWRARPPPPRSTDSRGFRSSAGRLRLTDSLGPFGPKERITARPQSGASRAALSVPGVMGRPTVVRKPGSSGGDGPGFC